MIRTKIKKLLQQILKESFGITNLPFKIEKPLEKEHGDYSTNLAFLLGRKFSKSPLEMASFLEKEVQKKGEFLFQKVKTHNGFLNFFLSFEAILDEFSQILKKKENYGDFPKNKQKVQVEFISANPTGPLHIGNGRGAFFGDCLANVLKKRGYEVEREYFINDAKFNSQIQTLGKTVLGKDTSYFSDYLKKKIAQFKLKLKKFTSEKEAGYFMAKEIIKDIKNFILKRLKIKFDNFVSEQKLYQESQFQKVYQLLEKKQLVYEKDGAKWLAISKFGAPKDEVIVRKTGEPSYFLSDIVYHKNKFDRHFDKIINIWGADHQGHVPKIKAVAKIFNYKGTLEILISQIVTLKGGEKLSKRRGKIITLEELVNEVGLDVARFFYLTKSLNSPMEFDLNLAKEKSQQNPLFYIQYAFARICSIFKRGKIKEKEIKIKKKELTLLSHPLEIDLMKELIRFPEIIEDCAKDYQLQRIPNYAFQLAQKFHTFYDQCPVLKERENLKKARISLLFGTKIVLKEVLSLMGISAPEKM